MIRLQALGQCTFEVGDHRVTPDADVLFALLLVLTCSAGQPVTRAELLELLWPDSDVSAARHRLRQALYQLRKLGAPIVTPDSVVNLREADVEVDFVACRNDRQRLADSVMEARRLDVLPYYAPTFSGRFARWVESERDRVRASLRRLLLELIAEKRAKHVLSEVIPLSRACLDLDPLNPEATVALAEALAVQGENAEALSVLDEYLDDLGRPADAARQLGELRRRIVESSRVRHDLELHPPLVGRKEILRDLNEWISARDTGPRALALVGEAGIGKTRLLNEAARFAAVHGIRRVDYRSSPNGEERPLVGLLDLLPLLLALPGAVGCAPESYATLTALARGGHIASAIPENTSESTFRFATIRRAVLDLFDATVGECEVMLSLDDAHCLDRPTLEILLDATRRGDRKLALLLALRPIGPTAGFVQQNAAVSAVKVRGLNAHESRLLLRRDAQVVAGSRKAKLIDWAAELADGNPFFLVELSAHCEGENATESLPNSLQVSLEKRLDALSATARLVVQACAVLAQNATLPRIELMLGLLPHETAMALNELEAAGLIVSRQAWVGCRHDLIADAVVRRMGASLETYLHRRCALVLDRDVQESPVASLAWDCARHWDVAHDHVRALELTGLIVDRLLSLGLPQAAADLCARAQRFCTTAEQEAERLLRLSQARRLLHDWEGAVRALEQRLPLVSRTHRRYSDDEIALFEARWWSEYDGRALRHSVHRVADQRAPVLHRLRMAVIGLVIADNRQEPNEARRIFNIVDAIEPATPRDDVERNRAITVYHTSFGDIDAAIHAAKRVVEAERVGNGGAPLLQALRWLSSPLKVANDVKGSIASLMESFRLASRLELHHEMWQAALYLQDVAIDCEDLSLAQDWTKIALELEGSLAVGGSRSANSAHLAARVALMQGNLTYAKSLLDHARSCNNTKLCTRSEEVLLALELCLRLRMRNDVPPRHMIARLRRLHLRTRYSGVSDFETGVLLNALLRMGNDDDARLLCREYFRARRNRIRPHSELRGAQSMLA